MWVIIQPKHKQRPMLLNLQHATSIDIEDDCEQVSDGEGGMVDTSNLLGVKVGAHFAGQKWSTELLYIKATPDLEVNANAMLEHLAHGLKEPDAVLDLRHYFDRLPST